MCSQNTLKKIIDKVCYFAKDTFGEKLCAVKLYGSYARGDFDDESDIDIMVLIHCSRGELRNYRHLLVDLGSDLSLENDITVSILAYDTETFDKFRDAMPFLQNVEREGIKVA